MNTILAILITTGMGVFAILTFFLANGSRDK